VVGERVKSLVGGIINFVVFRRINYVVDGRIKFMVEREDHVDTVALDLDSQSYD